MDTTMFDLNEVSLGLFFSVDRAKAHKITADVWDGFEKLKATWTEIAAIADAQANGIVTHKGMPLPESIARLDEVIANARRFALV